MCRLCEIRVEADNLFREANLQTRKFEILQLEFEKLLNSDREKAQLKRIEVIECFESYLDMITKLSDYQKEYKSKFQY